MMMQSLYFDLYKTCSIHTKMFKRYESTIIFKEQSLLKIQSKLLKIESVTGKKFFSV